MRLKWLKHSEFRTQNEHVSLVIVVYNIVYAIKYNKDEFTGLPRETHKSVRNIKILFSNRLEFSWF